MGGRVCETHQRWCPDGECLYCEPVGLHMITANINRETFRFWRDTRRPSSLSPSDVQRMMNEAWAKLAKRG